MYLTLTMNTADNLLQFIAVIFIFIVILVAAYFVTRWIGAVGMSQCKNRNIRVIEGCRVGQNKMVQIVKVGNKYFVLGIGKDEISCLGEVKEEDLAIAEDEVKPLPEFKDILAKVKEKIPTNKNKE